MALRASGKTGTAMRPTAALSSAWDWDDDKPERLYIVGEYLNNSYLFIQLI